MSFIRGRAEKTKYFIAHGTKDVIVPFSRAEEAAMLLEGFGGKVTLVAEELGHKVGTTGIEELSRWFRTNES